MNKVILKTQHRHPLGLYSVLPTLAKHPSVLDDVMAAAEAFDAVMLKRLKNVSAECKRSILELATTPLTLQQQARLYLRRYLQPNLQLKVPLLEIPIILRSYLLFEIS